MRILYQRIQGKDENMTNKMAVTFCPKGIEPEPVVLLDGRTITRKVYPTGTRTPEYTLGFIKSKHCITEVRRYVISDDGFIRKHYKEWRQV